MENTNNSQQEIIDYNDEPVIYCNRCLSLNIKSTGNQDYCDECGSTETLSCHIKEWQKLI